MKEYCGAPKKPTPYSVQVLQECIDLQLAKSNDYQNPNSTVKQADYYPSGVKTLHEIVHAKMLRLKSLIETFEQNPETKPNFESIQDSCKDAINYLSFLAAYADSQIDGQDKTKDMLNRNANNN